VERVSKDALALWLEGSTLLSADANYIEEERKKIRLTELTRIKNDLKKNGASETAVRQQTAVPGGEDSEKIAAAYQSELAEAKLEAELTVHVRDAEGRPISGAEVTVQNTNTGNSFGAITDSSGNVFLNALKPGNYLLRYIEKG